MKIKEKTLLLFETTAFYISNIIILAFLLNAFNEQSMKNLLTLGLSLLGLIGGLSALCYSSAQSQNDEVNSKIYKISGDRFMHSFITLFMGVIFSGAIIHFTKNGLFNIKSNLFIGIIDSILSIFALVYLIKSARSFSVGFHMIMKVLNDKFKLKDERLFDDLDNE